MRETTGHPSSPDNQQDEVVSNSNINNSNSSASAVIAEAIIETVRNTEITDEQIRRIAFFQTMVHRTDNIGSSVNPSRYIVTGTPQTLYNTNQRTAAQQPVRAIANNNLELEEVQQAKDEARVTRSNK